MDKFGEKIGIIAIILTTLSLGSSPHPFVLIVCYIIHESGHLIFSRLTGAKMKKIKIGALHLSLSYDCENLSYKRELLVQAGGIIFNLISALIVCLLPFLSGEVWNFFIISSVSLGLMNLYPISILDGGGMVKTLFCIFSTGDVAEKATKIISFIFALVMWLISVYLQIVFLSNISLFVISVILLIELCFTFKEEN